MTTTTDAVTVTTPDGERIPLEDAVCIVAGYAGRDATAVQAHIDELAAIGVRPPAHVPMFYAMEPETLTTRRVLDTSPTSSGEVEPVIVRQDGQVYLGVGSDHTDRRLEAIDVLSSKRVCPKPIASTMVPVDLDDLAWDECRISLSVDGVRYQEGGLDELRHPRELLDLLEQRGVVTADQDLVLFGGTVPLLRGAFVYGSAWELEITVPDGTRITHRYETASAA